MKGTKWAIGLLLVIFLTGCGVKEAEVPSEQPEEPEEKEETGSGPTRLLLSDEAMAYMYAEGKPNGFDFGGVEENGIFYYEFTRPEEPDFYLRISDDFETALVSYHGNTIKLNDRMAASGAVRKWNISAGYGGAVSGYGMPFWADMTGDGQPELLYFESGGGTGFHEDTCCVYDLTAMKEIPIIEPWREMAEFITVEPLEWKDDNIVCRVTDGDGETYTGYQWAPEETWQEYTYHPGKSGYTGISINEENHTLQIYMSFGLEAPHVHGVYMGELRTELAYDAEQKAIVRSGPITVTAYPGDKT